MAKKEPAKKGKKKHLTAITTHRADGGGFAHEHHYTDEDGNKLEPSFGGVSSNLDDVHQHIDDHFGDGIGDAEPEAPADGGAAAGPAAGGAGPTPGPGQ